MNLYGAYMFNKSVSSYGNDHQINSKRKAPRRANDNCVSIINGQMHPVENWSSGGMLIVADDKLFAKDQEYTFTIKFKLRDKIMEIDHKAKVIRKNSNKVALQLSPLTKKVKTNFQKVVDDYVSERFAESQSV